MNIPDKLVVAAVEAADRVLEGMDDPDPAAWPSQEDMMRAALAAAFAKLPECERDLEFFVDLPETWMLPHVLRAIAGWAT